MIQRNQLDRGQLLGPGLVNVLLGLSFLFPNSSAVAAGNATLAKIDSACNAWQTLDSTLKLVTTDAGGNKGTVKTRKSGGRTSNSSKSVRHPR